MKTGEKPQAGQVNPDKPAAPKHSRTQANTTEKILHLSRTVNPGPDKLLISTKLWQNLPK
ncbi:MAG: hypothetical protein WKG06_37610 [Segetibacter sp.]